MSVLSNIRATHAGWYTTRADYSVVNLDAIKIYPPGTTFVIDVDNQCHYVRVAWTSKPRINTRHVPEVAVPILQFAGTGNLLLPHFFRPSSDTVRINRSMYKYRGLSTLRNLTDECFDRIQNLEIWDQHYARFAADDPSKYFHRDDEGGVIPQSTVVSFFHGLQHLTIAPVETRRSDDPDLNVSYTPKDIQRMTHVYLQELVEHFNRQHHYYNLPTVRVISWVVAREHDFEKGSKSHPNTARFLKDPFKWLDQRFFRMLGERDPYEP